MNIALLLLAVVGSAVLIYFLLRSRKNAAPGNEGQLFIATASQSDVRARNLLPTNGSEDRRDLLKAPELPMATASEENFRPDPRVNWVVDVTFSKPTKLEKAVLLGGFDEKWMRKTGGPELYGKGAGDGHWTFVRAGDSPDLYAELAFAWRLVDDSEGSVKPVTATELTSYLKAIEQRLNAAGFPPGSDKTLYIF